MLHAVIMAGGAGTRFWPASRVDFPKQLLNLAGGRSMIQTTVDRVKPFCSPEQILIVTNRRLVDQIQRQLPEIPPNCIIGEPCKRDTAPCIALAAKWTLRNDPDALMVVMPSDHVIVSNEHFLLAIQCAVSLIEADPSRIVTFGITPDHPSEAFGYIERDDSNQSGDVKLPAFKVSRFREKPDRQTAEAFLESGRFYWNSGIFVWKSQAIVDALNEHVPEMMEYVDRIAASFESPDFDNVFQQQFNAISGISIDYAVMENYSNSWVIEAPFSWNDVGNWSALPQLIGSDQSGNTVSGRHVSIDSTNCIVRCEKDRLIATIGVDSLIVVQTENAILVADRNREADVKKIVEYLEKNSLSDYL